MMTFLSLFMTSTGIFCFVPISQRLLESGIIPASNRWRFGRHPAACTPILHTRKEERVEPLHAIGNLWNNLSVVRIPLYSTDGAFVSAPDQQLATQHANSEQNASLRESSTTNSIIHSTSLDTFYGRDSASFISDTTLCDSCNMLLRHEIPPDHIPSVIRTLELFGVQDRSYNTVFDECEVVSLAAAFSMLRL